MASPSTPDVSDENFAYGRFLEAYFLDIDPITPYERTRFLLFWLSKYIFFAPTLKVSKDFLLLTANLAVGKILALGPLILATLYRDITHASLSMASKEEGTLFGPF